MGYVTSDDPTRSLATFAGRRSSAAQNSAIGRALIVLALTIAFYGRPARHKEAAAAALRTGQRVRISRCVHGA
jgi:hypothetical protein